MTGKNKKIILSLAGITLLAGGIYYLNHRHYTPKTADEFFKRNGHLTRPVKRLKPLPDQLREGDAFKEGDYQLLAGHVYPVDFSKSIKFTQASQAEQKYEIKGKVLLKSLGLVKGRLVVLAEFAYEKSNELKKLSPKILEEFGILSNEKQKPNASQILKRSILIKLEPTGTIREMFALDSKVFRTSLEAKLELLDKIFLRLSSIKPGTSIVTEIDEQGYPYPMKYTIEDQGNVLRIKANAEQNYGMNETESKAAAAGAQGMGQMSIVGNQNANMDWQWSKSEQRPLEQNAQGQTDLSLRTQLIAKISSDSKTHWGETYTDETIQESAAKFTFPISVPMLRAMINSKQKKVLNKEPAMASKDKNKKEEKLTPEQAHDKAFSQMAEDLKNNPEAIASYREMALKAEGGSEQLSMVLGSLGYEGSEDSQKALVDVYGRSDIKEVDRQKIFTELTLAQQALSPEVKKFLKTEFEKVDYSKSVLAKQAGLALASSIARDGDPETIQYFHDKWDAIGGQSKDDQEKRGRKRYLMNAMGNAKSDVFMSEANSLKNATDPALRSAAATSVRFAQSKDSRSLLIDLLKDPDPEVRVAVVQAMGFQPFDELTQNTLKGCAGDKDTGVKLNCYRLLGYQVHQPGIREYLSSRAGAESDPQVKHTIEESLSVEGE